MLLLSRLPAESSWVSAIAGQVTPSAPDPETERLWSTTDHLLADTVDSLHHVAWTIAQVNSSKRVPRPVPVRRPGRTATTTRQARMPAERRSSIDAWNLPEGGPR